jgi:hypothetical protein
VQTRRLTDAENRDRSARQRDQHALAQHAEWRGKLNSGLDPGVACAQHGWWQRCDELDQPPSDPFELGGVNLNLVLRQTRSDPRSGSSPLRASFVTSHRADAEASSREEPPQEVPPPVRLCGRSDTASTDVTVVCCADSMSLTSALSVKRSTRLDVCPRMSAGRILRIPVRQSLTLAAA